MRITDEIKDGIVVFHLGGKVMGGPDSTMFHGKVHEYVDAGKSNIVIDLSKVEWVDSIGLGMFLSALATARKNGGELKLTNVTEKIKNLLIITRLVTVFESCDSTEEAIKSF
jgi:anti-sigma B factor antagonist